MAKFELPDIRVPAGMKAEEMPDLLRHWYLGSRGRRHMVLRRFSEVDRWLVGNPGASVLDIGSAWGYNVMALEALGMRVVGMDLVVDQFEVGARIAHENGAEFRVVGGDAARLPFGDGQFDGITMVETFEHVFEDDRPAVLRECHRVLKDGGRLVLSTPNYYGIVERFKRVAVRLPWLRRRLPTMCYPADGVDRSTYHPYRYHQPATPEAIRGYLEGAGFSVRSVTCFLFVTKNTPDGLFPLVRSTETLMEQAPILKQLAATVCVVADRQAGP
ncbi:MAG: methyltransferase domain-containing protein [Candidatus Krumholzibacteria bacterium]